jgi:hypothetical protein
VAQAKQALTKNDKYTPAMLVMAKAYYKLRKYEWVRHLWKMMQANNAPEPEQAEMYHLLAWMEIEKKNTPGSIEMLKKATEAGRRTPCCGTTSVPSTWRPRTTRRPRRPWRRPPS